MYSININHFYHLSIIVCYMICLCYNYTVHHYTKTHGNMDTYAECVMVSSFGGKFGRDLLLTGQPTAPQPTAADPSHLVRAKQNGEALVPFHCLLVLPC